MEVWACFDMTVLGMDVCSHQLAFWFSTVLVPERRPQEFIWSPGKCTLQSPWQCPDSDHMVDDLHEGNTSHSPLSLKPPASLEAAIHIGCEGTQQLLA